MKKTMVVATFLALGAGAVGLSAPNGLALKGSDTLFALTQAVIAACPNATGTTYAGTGSGAGENAMLAGTQTVAPMSRFLGANACAATGATPTQSEGIAVAADGISIVAAQSHQVACDPLNTDASCNHTGGAATGLARNTVLTDASLPGGTYTLDGHDVSGLDDDARSRLRNQKIGFIFQGFNLIPDLNLFDNVDVPLRYRGMPAAERRQRIEDALARVGLGSRMKHFPAELSGGQQQRTAIARALAGSPRLLLADEPTGNLDSQMARGVMELLEEINRQGTTIIMVTHDPELAARAQRNVHIIDGQVVDIAEEPRFHAHAAKAALA